MNESFLQLRKEYRRAELRRATLVPEPFGQFRKWFDEASNANLEEPNAMMLATTSADGQPSLRAVLLKAWSEAGFVFFTNYESRKGQEITKNPKVALLFYWAELERQIRIEGRAIQTSRELSEAYFSKRPLSSQISAAVSAQSQKVGSRAELEDKARLLAKDFAERPVPCPTNWGGYEVKPDRFEFWQGRENRLHDRFEYIAAAGKGWKINRLAP